MFKSKSSKKIAVIILILFIITILAISIPFAYAYMTDADKTINTFSIGDVTIDLIEPNFDKDKNLIAKQEITKDPQVKNIGINDAYIFTTVTMPYANVNVVSENGSTKAKGDNQLFTYTLDDNWTLIESGTIDGNTIGDVNISHKTGAKGYVDTVNKTITYVYAYTGANPISLEKVAKDVTTTNVFSSVKLINVLEDDIENSVQKINIKSYAIQSDIINNGDNTINGDNSAGITDPKAVWAIIQNSSPSDGVIN